MKLKEELEKNIMLKNRHVFSNEDVKTLLLNDSKNNVDASTIKPTEKYTVDNIITFLNKEKIQNATVDNTVIAYWLDDKK